MRVYTSSPDSVVTYLFPDCERSRDCSAYSVRSTCDDQSIQYTSTDTYRRLAVLRVCAMFEGLTKFCFVFRFGFRATLLDFTSRIERLHFCYYCAYI